MGGAAAAHVEAAGAFFAPLDAGQELERLQHVHLAGQRGQAFDLVDLHVDGAHARRLLDALGLDDDFLALQRRRSQRHRQRRVTPQAERVQARPVTDVAEDHGPLARREGEAVKAVAIRRRARVEGGRVDGCAGQALARLGVLDVAT